MTRYLPIVFVVILAMGGGVMIVPGAWEMAFMKLRDKDFSAAERSFEDKFLAGDRTREILLPLAELYVRSGRVDKAIDVLRKCSAAHPNDADVTARLAALLQEAQQPKLAIEELETLAAKAATPQALRELDRQYDIAEDMNGRMAALLRLAKLGAASAKESLVLTNLLAASNRRDEALTVAYNAIKLGGAKAPPDLVQVFVALAIDANRRDLIASSVGPWAVQQTSAGPLNAAAAALTDKGAGRDAIFIVRSSAAFRRQDPASVVLAAQLESLHGDKVKALALLDVLRAAGRMPASEDANFVTLALGQTETRKALDHIAARGPAAFDDAILLYAIGQAALTGQKEWLSASAAKMAAPDIRPLPLARIALALGDANRAAEMARAAERDGVSVTLAQLYADLGDMESAARVFDASVSSADDVGVAALPQATAVAIALKRPQMALALAERLVVQDKSAEAAIQRTRALTLNGRAVEALEILAVLNAKSDLAEISEIEALAAAKRFVELRRKLVTKLTQDSVPAMQRTNVVFMLNDLKIELGSDGARLADGLIVDLKDKTISGAAREARLSLLAKAAPEKALPFFKSAGEADPDKQGYVYAKLLKDLNRTAELKAFLLFAAKNGKTAKVRDDFLFELIKQGAGPGALPLLAARANADGAKWFFAYDQELAKSGTRAERLAALQSFAAMPATAPDLRRQIAFQILNLGDKALAEPIFRGLAETAGPSSPDVRQLAFLWGPRPPQDALAWLKARAENATGADRAQWAALLVNAGDPRGAETVLAAGGSSSDAAALAGVYAETKNVSALRTLIKSRSAAADRKTLMAFGDAASALDLNAEASRAYEAASAFDLAGRAAFFSGDQPRAIRLLSQARNNGETAFYLAEALTATNRRREAEPHYRNALQLLNVAPQAAKMRVVAMARLKDHDAVERELSRLSGDPNAQTEARTAYAGALLDQGDTMRAAALLDR